MNFSGVFLLNTDKADCSGRITTARIFCGSRSHPRVKETLIHSAAYLAEV